MKIVVYCRDHLGDAVNSTGLLYGIKKLFPNSELVVDAGALTVMVLETQPSVDKCIVRHARQGVLGKLKSILVWRKEKFDVAIALDDSNGFILKAFLAGVPKRYGITRGNKYQSLYTGKVLIDYSVHEVRDNGQNLLRLLGCSSDFRAPRVNVPNSMGNHEKYIKEKQVIVHFGASEEKRKLGVVDQNFIVNIIRKYGFNELVIGNETEIKNATELGFNTLHHTIHPLELFDLIEHSKYFIGTDSGPAQIAGACDIPGIILYGSSDPNYTSPYGNRLRIVKLGSKMRDEIECELITNYQ